MLHLPLMLRGLAGSRYSRREQEQQQQQRQEKKRSRSSKSHAGSKRHAAYPSQQRRLPSVLAQLPSMAWQAASAIVGASPAGMSQTSAPLIALVALARSSRASLSKAHRAWRIMDPSPHAASVLKSPRGLSNLQSRHGAVSTPLVPALTLGLNQVWSPLVALPHSCPFRRIGYAYP